MSISSYSELQTAVTDWLEDRTDLAAFVPDFITLAEGYINAELRVFQMETVETLTAVDGAADLPADLIQILHVAGSGTSPRRELAYLTRKGADDFYPSRAAGLGTFYGITGNTLTTYPMISGAIELTYIAGIPALSDALPTNWLLTKRPELYLRASLMQAAEFIKDDGEAAKQKALADMVITQMNTIDMVSRGRVGVTLRGPTP